LAHGLPQWIILDTSNSTGPLIPATDPTDVHHCTELPGVYPYTFCCLQKWQRLQELNL